MSKKFEELGKELLKHKYMYYRKGEPSLTDYEYDMLEDKYIKMAKSLKKEPAVHLIADWSELAICGGFHAACVVGYPETHPWANIYNQQETD